MAFDVLWIFVGLGALSLVIVILIFLSPIIFKILWRGRTSEGNSNKWIGIAITVMADKSEVDKVKKVLKPFKKKLNWTIVSDRYTHTLIEGKNKITSISVMLTPKRGLPFLQIGSGEGYLSPEEFLKNREEIIKVNYEIMKI